jgi:integrase
MTEGIILKKVCPTKLNVHSLCHTNASLLIASGTDVATVAGLLGHSQPSTTLDIYSHAFDENKEAASEKLQTGLKSLTKIQQKTVYSHNNAA